MAKKNGNNTNDKTMEAWIWDAACSIRGAADAAKYKDFILPLIFVKRLCDVFDDEIDRIAEKVKTRTKALQLVERDKSLVRFYLPIKPKDPETESTWDVIRKLSDKIGQQLTDILRAVAKENSSLQGIIDRVDFNITTHGHRDIDDDRLSKLIEKITEKRIGLKDVEADIIGRSYEYLIRKFAEGSGKSAGEFYTPAEVGFLMAKLLEIEPGMEIYDPCCGSGGLLVKCELVLSEKMHRESSGNYAPLKLYGQEYTPSTWAMSKMNMVIHDMEGEIEIGDTLKTPKFTEISKVKRFDRIVANPMWNQTGFSEDLYSHDRYGRFPFGYPGSKADWGWMQHINSSLKENGRAAIILGIGSATRGSNANTNIIEKRIRKMFVDADLLEAVVLLPFNLFYNTDSPGVIYLLNREKSMERKGKVLFINASENFEKGKPKNFFSKEGEELVVSAFKGFKDIEGVCKILDREVLKREDFVFNPSRYVLKIKPIKPSTIISSKIEFENSLQTTHKLIEELLKDLECISKSRVELTPTVFGQISKEVKLVPLGKFVKQFVERKGDKPFPVFSCSKIHGIIRQDEKFKNVIAGEIQTNYKVIHPNMFAFDPMLLWDGSIGRNYYPYAGILSPAYTVFEADESKINLDYLDFILKHQLMLPFYVSVSDGTNMRRRKAKFSDFKKIQIPVINEEKQRLIAMTLKFSRVVSSIIGQSDSILNDYFNSVLVGDLV
jgi:type I restriction enzyme M protein